jgi:hypothetical protein
MKIPRVGLTRKNQVATPCQESTGTLKYRLMRLGSALSSKKKGAFLLDHIGIHGKQEGKIMKGRYHLRFGSDRS